MADNTKDRDKDKKDGHSGDDRERRDDSSVATDDTSGDAKASADRQQDAWDDR